MQEYNAKRLFQSNDLVKVVVQPSGDNRGWTLTLVSSNGDKHMLNTKRSAGPRVFKTSDACLRCCARIGFNAVSVML